MNVLKGAESQIPKEKACGPLYISDFLVMAHGISHFK